MDEVTVVAEGVFPAVARALPKVLQVFLMLRFSCTSGMCVWRLLVFFFVGIAAEVGVVPMYDVEEPRLPVQL